VNDRLRLAELLAIRLCHDLSGPLGTLMGSLEMVNDDPEESGEALALAGEVATSLARRLRLFRAAWGGSIAAQSPADLEALAAGLPNAQRVAVDLGRLRAGSDIPPAAARLLLNVLLLAGESLPAGGSITVAGEPAGDIMVAIAGARAAWPAGLAAMLTSEDAAWAAVGRPGPDGPRLLQGPLTALLAHAAGIRLSMLQGGPSEAPPLLLSPPRH
jgi:histidine phosphotransferase ChpT